MYACLHGLKLWPRRVMCHAQHAGGVAYAYFAPQLPSCGLRCRHLLHRQWRPRQPVQQLEVRLAEPLAALSELQGV